MESSERNKVESKISALLNNIVASRKNQAGKNFFVEMTNFFLDMISPGLQNSVIGVPLFSYRHQEPAREGAKGRLGRARLTLSLSLAAKNSR